MTYEQAKAAAAAILGKNGREEAVSILQSAGVYKTWGHSEADQLSYPMDVKSGRMTVVEVVYR